MASHRLSLANSWDQLAERPLIIARHHTTLQLRRNYGSLISLSNPTYHISETLEPHPLLSILRYQPGPNFSSLIFHECRKSCLLTRICQQLLNHQLGSHLMSQLTFRATLKWDSGIFGRDLNAVEILEEEGKVQPEAFQGIPSRTICCHSRWNNRLWKITLTLDFRNVWPEFRTKIWI